MIRRAVGHEVLDILSKDSTQLVIACDGGGRICLVNPAAEKVLAVSAAEVVGMTWRDACAAHPALNAVNPFAEQALSGTPVVFGQVVVAGAASVPVVVVYAPESGQEAGWGMEEAAGFREIVHDLKMPVSAATSFIDLACTEGVSAEKRGHFLRRAQRSLDTMFTMINELLDVAWLRAEGELHCAEIDLNSIVDSGMRYLDGFAQHSGLTFHCVFEGAACPVCGDERRLLGVVTNLISNAIKYSADGGVVDVVVDSVSGRARVRVIDRGPGIAPEHLKHIWEPYFRVPDGMARRVNGSGLGLSLVKDIIDKHGGEVFVSSVPGEGSSFGFWLPQGNGCQDHGGT